MSNIEWTDETWNPTVGCSRVSKGCEHCYAEGVAHRGMSPQHRGLTVLGKHGPRWNATVRLVESALAKPLSWKKPRRVFVNSMSDLFHEAVPFSYVAACFEVMAKCPQHTFQVLTKRPTRMRHFMEGMPAFVLPNIWLGVSAEDQDTADERISELLDVPAAVRFVSYEPALGPVNFHAFLRGAQRDECLAILRGGNATPVPGLDWVIVGGESGAGARPFDLEWARSTVEQCKSAGVACFVKQLGRVPHTMEQGAGRSGSDLVTLYAGKNRKGADPSEWPEDLRVREFPS